MNILDSKSENNSINVYLNTLQTSIQSEDSEHFKMCLKGYLLKSLEHQWKQPLNYISTNLLNLEINAELGKLDIKTVNEFNQNIENAIQSISDNISFYNKLFVTSNKKNNFFLNNIAKNYFNIVQHKIRNNDIQFDYKELLQNETPLNNHENETALQIILILFIFSDILIEKNLKNITMQLQCNSENNYVFLEININNLFTQNEIFDNYSLHWQVIKHLLEKTHNQLVFKNFDQHTSIILQLDT